MSILPRILFLAAASFWLLAPVTSWAETFEGIEIAPEVNEPPYDRDLCNHWIDTDGDHENTRQEVLIQESLVPATIRAKPKGKCKVVEWLCVGPYTGAITTDPKELQVDHKVPLKGRPYF